MQIPISLAIMESAVGYKSHQKKSKNFQLSVKSRQGQETAPITINILNLCHFENIFQSEVDTS